MRKTQTSPVQIEARFSRLLAPVAAHPQPEHVHRLRTTIRRIETLVAAHEGLRKKKKGKKLMRHLARLRRRAGRVRDLDVQLAALKTISLRSEEESKAQLASYLEEQRSKRLKKLLAALRPKQRARLRELLLAHSRRRSSDLQSQRRHSLRAAQAWTELWRGWNAHKPASPAEVHAFRIQCKRLRYSYELAEKTPLQTACIHKLEAIQDAIGSWHDWLTLSQTASERLQPSSPLLAAIRNMTGARMSEALRVCEREMSELALLQALRKQPAAVQEPTKSRRAAS